MIPGAASATSIAAGVIYGTPLGVALVGTSCAVGAGVSFVIARHAARPIVEKLFIKDGSRFAALDQAVMRDGAQIVLLARLSPFSPYVAMSFLFGLTAVDFWPYIGASAVGILPASFVYVYMGGWTTRDGSGASTSGLPSTPSGSMTILVTVRHADCAETPARRASRDSWPSRGGTRTDGAGDGAGGPGGRRGWRGGHPGLLEMAGEERGTRTGPGRGQGPGATLARFGFGIGVLRVGAAEAGVEMTPRPPGPCARKGDTRTIARRRRGWRFVGGRSRVAGARGPSRERPDDAAVRATPPGPTNRGR